MSETREALLAKLNELESEPISKPEDTKADPVKDGGDMFVPMAPGWYGYDKVFEPLIKVQPENPPETDFHIGDWWQDARELDCSAGRQAIPEPRWQQPGAPNTRETDNTYWTEHALWYRSMRTFEDVIRHTKSRINNLDRFNADPNEPKLLAERLAWLTGLWNARGMTPPSKADFERWAQEPTPYSLLEERSQMRGKNG